MVSIKIVPNLLCFLRIVASFVAMLLLVNEYKYLATSVIIVGAISDFFDGYIARKYNAITKFGALFDPLADKIFTNLMLWGIWFYTPNITLFAVSLVLTIRDLALVVGSIFVIGKKTNVPLQPMFVSKICTTTIFTYIVLCLISTPRNKFVTTIGLTSLALVVITATLYAVRYIRNTCKFRKSK